MKKFDADTISFGYKKIKAGTEYVDKYFSNFTVEERRIAQYAFEAGAKWAHEQLLDKDKLFIVLYFNIGGIDDEDVPSYVTEVYDHTLKDLDDTVRAYIIPIRNGETRMEFYNIENAEKKTLDDIIKMKEDLDVYIEK